jgi:hypothetical protein
MRYWLLAMVAFAALLVGLGEPLVCLGFLALPFIGWQSDKLLVRIGSVLAAAVGLFLHSQGYKLFGSAQIVATPPLKGAAEVVSLEPPDRVRFANGKIATLEGVYFPRTADLTEPNERNYMLWHLLGERSKTKRLEIRVHDENHRGECLRRNLYWCGNTFFPAVLPERLPSHTLEDIGTLLVGARLALPNGKVSDPAYREQLLEVFDRSAESSHYPMSGLVKRGDEAAVALGRSLINPQSSLFVAGAFLLIAAQDVESYPQIEREILRRHQRNHDDYDAVAQARSSELDTLLAWVNVGEAQRRMLAAPLPSRLSRENRNGNGYAWGTDAAILASHGDLSGFDRADRIMSDEQAAASDRQVLSSVIPHYFKWPMESPLFSTWYAEVRPRLRAGRDEFGLLAIWLEDGKPFDDAYHRSIKQVSERR